MELNDSAMPVPLAQYEDFYAISENHIDYEDMESINKSIYNARMSLFKITNIINQLERKEALAKNTYDKAMRKEILLSDKKTASDRKIHAEIKCEHLEEDYFYTGQAKKEYERLAHTLRTELQALTVVSNNVRQQMRV